MKNFLFTGAMIAGMLLFAGCSTTRVVKPLAVGERQVNASLGGPAGDFAIKTILPLASIGYAQGIKENVTAFGGVHLTSLGFQNIHLDVGVNYGLLRPDGWRPGVSVNGVLNPVFTLRDSRFRLYPEISPNVYWEDRLGITYIGMANWFDPQNGLSVNDDGKFWVPTFNMGQQFQLKHNNWFDLEVRYMGINQEVQAVNNIQTLSPGEKGGMAFFIGMRFGLSK